jgi:hypothetical protein
MNQQQRESLSNWYEDICRATGRFQLQLILDLKKKIREGEFDERSSSV